MYEGRSHYELLGLKTKPNATLIEIKDAYRKTCHEHYCALYKDTKLLVGIIILFNRAFLDLTDVKKRRAYDHYERLYNQSVRDYGVKNDDEYTSLYECDYGKEKQKEFVEWLEEFSDAIKKAIENDPVLSKDTQINFKIDDYFRLILEQEKGKLKTDSKR